MVRSLIFYIIYVAIILTMTNQIAICKNNFTEKLLELKNLHFLKRSDLDLPLNDLWLSLLSQCFPDAKSEAMITHHLSNILATAEQNVIDFTAENQINANSFNLVALQLLGFEADVDFSLANPKADWEKLKLPFLPEITKTSDLVTAFYLLLCTHTKHGQTFLDYLATLGYFKDFPAAPLFFNGKAQPVFKTTNLIHEVVFVETDLDTDNDGQADLVKVEIIRPQVAAALKLPVLFTASPYNQGTNDQTSDAMLHNVNQPIPVKTPNNVTYEEIAYHEELPNVKKRHVAGHTQHAEQSFGDIPHYSLNDYFLPRGFASVYSAGIGTKDSDGVRTTGTSAETLAATAVIEWLNGKRKAFTNKTDNIEIKAEWCSGNVAMTGKSYLGTLATAAATTGVDGLKTIIAEAAISSWYDYYREGGLVISPGGYPGEDADTLAELCFSRRKNAADFLKIKPFFSEVLKYLAKEEDRITGNYNTFWDARNYLKDVDKIKANIILVHGLNDWNVKPKNAYQLWQAIQDLPIVKKLILHQGQHIYINNFRSLDFTDMMNLWLSNQLYFIDNHAPEHLPTVLMQDNTKVETWHTRDNWDPQSPTSFALNDGQLTAKPAAQPTIQTFKDNLPKDIFEKYCGNIPLWKNDLMTPTNNTLAENRLLFCTEPLPADQVILGQPTVNLKVAASVNHGLISCMLVDYGESFRLKANPTLIRDSTVGFGYHDKFETIHEFMLDTQKTPFKLISQGHLNLQNKTALWKNDEIVAGTFYNISLNLQPTAYRLLEGHQLGLIVYATDLENTLRGNEAVSYQIDGNDSELILNLLTNY